MSIRDIVQYEDPDTGHDEFKKSLRQNDHVIVIVDTDSGQNESPERHYFLNNVVRANCPEFKTMPDSTIGSVTSHEGDGHVWYHSIALVKDGKHSAVSPNLKEIVADAMNVIYLEHEDAVSRPMKVWFPSLWTLAQVSGKNLTGNSVNLTLDFLGGLAESDAPVDVHWM